MLVPAKVNLRLKIGRKLASGKRCIVTLMYKVPIYDRLTVKHTSSSVHKIICDRNIEDNLALKAVEMYCQHINTKDKFEIRLKKQIPIGSGLGGASMNAAYTLLFINRLNNNSLNMSSLCKLARALGTDVSFGILNTDYGIGVCHGEYVKSVDMFSIKRKTLYMAVIYGLNTQSTADLYSAISSDETQSIDTVTEINNIKNIMINYYLSDRSIFLAGIENDFCDRLLKTRDDISEILEFGKNIKGVYVATVSGTGSSCVFIMERNVDVLLRFRDEFENNIFRRREFSGLRISCTII